MKKIAILLALVSTSVFAHPPHMDLEMTAEEYAALLSKPSFDKSRKKDDVTITTAINLGTRLSKWIGVLNANRSADAAIRLSSKEEQSESGIPINQPKIYSPSTVAQELKEIMAIMPKSMQTVLTGNGELPTTIDIDDETFIKISRRVTKQYEMAARYKLNEPYREHFIERSNRDVRGYYYLKSNKITESDVSDLKQLPKTKQKEIRDALIQLCQNGKQPLSDCKKDLKKAERNGDLGRFYTRNFSDGYSVWSSFFDIPLFGGKRGDVIWQNNLMTVPFNTPAVPKLIPYLQDNIEDEFKWKDWSLKVQFGNYPEGVKLSFIPGVTPHVRGLGSNEIFMDANMSIDEYDSQWTIRHEFGHIVGLPDCYHEFYDVDLQAYVTYQLDTTDLMCSRAGKMNERIYSELKRVYAP